MPERPRSGSMSTADVLQMILSRVDSIHEEQKELRDKIEESSKDTRKYVDTRLKELDERIKDRERTEIVSLKEANTAQDVTIGTMKKELAALVSWADGVKARWGLIGGALSLCGGGLVAGTIALAKHLAG